VIVLVIGINLKWARGWINIPWIPFTIQPTEFLKFTIIIYLATFLKKYKGYLSDFQNGFIPFIAIIWTVIILVWLQPDFGTIMVIVPVSVIMFFYAWANIKHLLIMFLLWFIFSISIYLAWDYDKATGKNLNSLWYITQRIDNFLADNEKAIKNKTINYQTEQALIAIWSWGFTGLGFGKSIQKFWYLPEVQWDFIFSVVIEELWFIWGLILLWLYWYIWYRGVYIATRVHDLFAQFTVVGVSSWILLQAFINIWVNLNIMPLTGITLPFISYGWSSLLSLMIALWVMLNISRYIDEKQNFSRISRKKFMI
jgi:cell division protein FtsW